jgi:hypothetical protein
MGAPTLPICQDGLGVTEPNEPNAWVDSRQALGHVGPGATWRPDYHLATLSPPVTPRLRERRPIGEQLPGGRSRICWGTTLARSASSFVVTLGP